MGAFIELNILTVLLGTVSLGGPSIFRDIWSLKLRGFVFLIEILILWGDQLCTVINRNPGTN